MDEHKNKMYELFGEERTMAEMDKFLKFDFIKRSGGIGVTRLIRSMKLEVNVKKQLYVLCLIE